MTNYRTSYLKTILIVSVVGVFCLVLGGLWWHAKQIWFAPMGEGASLVLVWIPLAILLGGALLCGAVVLGGVLALQGDWRRVRKHEGCQR